MSDAGSISQTGGSPGQAGFQTPGGGYAAFDFAVRQIIAGKSFATLVQVKSVSGGGPSGAPATIACQPMVNQQDGLGNQVPHNTVYNLPAMRHQGGSAAIIVDPVVGDIGIAIICDRDISNVKATGSVSPPGSFRQNNWSDGCYVGGYLNGAPQTYVHISPDGVSIVTAGTISAMSTGAIDLTSTGGEVTVTSPTTINLNAPVLKNNGTIIDVP